MSDSHAAEAVTTPQDRICGKTWAALIVFYFVALAAATYPFVLHCRTSLPGSLLDPLQHLWIMKWYRTCLLEGRSPVLSPEIQYPVGAPLGNFSPLHFQSMLFLPLSAVLKDDVISFNVIWAFGMITTALATFLLAWHVVRHKPAAALAGLLAMLSGPMLLHARAHLELIYLGCFPLFLVGWMRFIDQPSRRRLLIAFALYLLVALCAAYYVVFATVPAALYVAYVLIRQKRADVGGWLKSRIGWVAGFSGLVLPGLALIFGNHLWAMAKGYSLPRPLSEFNGYGAPAWTYLAPTSLNRLSILLPFNPYIKAGFRWTVGERASYLGVVTLLLVAYAAARGVRRPKLGYFWLATAAMLILGCGASWDIGPWHVGLPAAWLKRWVFAFKMIRVPARFNLFVTVGAAVLAAAGFRELVERLKTRTARGAAFAVVAILAVFDLSTVPFPSPKVPPLPRCYAEIQAKDPKATFLDAPQFASSGSELYSLCGYWQTLHRSPTTAGYSGHGNVVFDNRLTWNSPFIATRLSQPDYLRNAASATFDIVTMTDFRGYAWLYLTANKLDYVVLHHWAGGLPDGPAYSEAMADLLANSRVYEDEVTTVFARSRMAPPTTPTLLSTDGWRPKGNGQTARVIGKSGRLAIYNPDPERPLRFAFEARAFRKARTVRLVSEGRELASWTVAPDSAQLYMSGPIRLPRGLQEARLECDAEEKPRHARERAQDGDEAAYGLTVTGLNLSLHPDGCQGRRGGRVAESPSMISPQSESPR